MDETDKHSDRAKLLLLANACLAALSAPDRVTEARPAAGGVLPEEASIGMLKAVLRQSIPALRASHREPLALQAEEALAEAVAAESPER